MHDVYDSCLKGAVINSVVAARFCPCRPLRRARPVVDLTPLRLLIGRCPTSHWWRRLAATCGVAHTRRYFRYFYRATACNATQRIA